MRDSSDIKNGTDCFKQKDLLIDIFKEEFL